MLKRYFHLFTACEQSHHFLQLMILFHLLTNCIYQINTTVISRFHCTRVRTEALILEKVLKFALFQTLKKSGKSG